MGNHSYDSWIWVTRWWTEPIPEQATDRTSEQSKTLTEPSFPLALIAFVSVRVSKKKRGSH